MLANVRQTISNFGKNVRFRPVVSCSPQSVEEVLEIFRQHPGKQIRVSGRLHSWSQAIVADQVHLDLRNLNAISLNRDGEKTTVTVGAGCQIKTLLAALRQEGLTLPTVGLIDEQTVAGAIATGTHGSGKQCLSHFVQSMQIVHDDPETGEPVITLVDSGPELDAARCSLGMLGVVVAVTFECRPTYNILEYMQRQASLSDVIASEHETPLQQFYLVPWSWDYYVQHRSESQLPSTKSAFWFHLYWTLVIDWGLHITVFALAKIFRSAGLIRFFFRRVLPFTVARKWQVVDDSHKMLVMEHELFRHIEIEMFVTRSKLAEACEFVRDVVSMFGGQPVQSGNDDLARQLRQYHGKYCHHYPICIRRVLPDTSMISMASMDQAGTGEDWYAISFISYAWPNDRTGFFAFADYLASAMSKRFGARAHWGKYNPLSGPENDLVYPGLKAFNAIRKNFDPQDRFGNPWLLDATGDERFNQV